MSGTLDILASNTSITYLPAGAWNTTTYDGDLSYAYGNALIIYTFAVPATGIAWYGSKSGSGGNAQVCIDCPFNSTSGFLVDYTDPTAGNYLPEPGVIAAWTDLTFGIHNISISNLYDTQANNGQGGFGWLYFEGFQLTGTDGSNAGTGTQASAVVLATSTPATSTTATPTSASPTSMSATTVTVTESVTLTDFVTVTASAPTQTHSSSASKAVASRCLGVLALLLVGYASL